MGSGFASWVGGCSGLRRADMRTLVACGSAGAIGAAFGAPLTGAFYAFELILATYTPFGLAPIGAAAIAGVLVSRLLGSSGNFMWRMFSSSALSETDMALLLLLGIICAAFGIAIMRAVAFVESVFRLTRLPQALQPALGGLVVGALALVTPHVLSSGHSGLFELFSEEAPAIGAIGLALVLKAIASAVSLGSGFRGGLFFASLFLGGMTGQALCFRHRPHRPIARARPSGLHDHRNGGACGCDRRRPFDDELPGARDHRRFPAEPGHACGLDDRLRRRAAQLRLFICDVAFASARRINPQRPGRRLDSRPDASAV